MTARVLIIAGSDSCGGAGVQADIKTVTMLGGYAATAITAVTIQDTVRVHGVHSIPPQVIREQIDVVLRDIGADCIKIGMIGSAEAGQAILKGLDPFPDIPVVLDPVLVATSGDSLGSGDMPDLLRSAFIPRAALVTPNIPELSALSGVDVVSLDDAEEAARRLLNMGAKGVLAKGGHREGSKVTDLLVTAAGTDVLESPRIDTKNTHGTGCTLASAVAAGLAKGLSLNGAVHQAVGYVREAIKRAPGLGHGHGPLAHNWQLPQSEH